MAKTAHDETTIGTEHWRSEEWKEKGRVASARMKPDPVWLRHDSRDERLKIVVDMKVTSTDVVNGSFTEKDDKYRVWATSETWEKKVSKVMMVPLIISHDGAVHRASVRRWKDFAPDIKIDWVRMAQNVLRYNIVIVGRFFNKGSWVSEAWRKERPEESSDDEIGAPERTETGEEKRAVCD